MFNIAGNAPSGYDVKNSLRLKRNSSARLSRTFASSSGTTNTWSFWMKRGTLGAAQHFFSWTNLSTTSFQLVFDAGDTISFANVAGGATNAVLTTTQVFRDPSAWYHIVFVLDTTQATAANRIKLYVNGVQVTAFATATYPAQNTAMAISTSGAWAIGARGGANDLFFDGYLAEYNFIDGQALTPSSFGSTDAVTGQWLPKLYSGTYGTSGFYLKFSDIAQTVSSNVGLGKDFSTNTNFWVTNNISVTTGTTYDAMTDSPTVTSETVANYPVFNSLATASSLINGNLNPSASGNLYAAPVTMAFPATGKFYAEFTILNITSPYPQVGIMDLSAGFRTNGSMQTVGNGVVYSANGQLHLNGSLVTSYATYTNNDVISIAYDCTTGYVWLAKNGTWQNSGNPAAGTGYVTGTTASTVGYVYAAATYSSATLAANFGQQPFAYTPPTGFVRLNTFNLPNSTIKKGSSYMDATTYTGNGTTQTITNSAGFKPDLVWGKARSQTYSNMLYDSVRGVGTSKMLLSNTTDAEGSVPTNANLTSFNSNGFSVGATSSTNVLNGSGDTLVGWQWQAGQGSTTSGTGTGGISSVVQSVNTSAGFSVVTFTGNGTNGTFTHGLGVAPKMFIVKNRTAAASWGVWHNSLTTPSTALLFLDTTGAQTNNATYWNSTAPTSSVITMGTSWAAANYVAYCWAEIEGFSKFGSYTGNGSADGPFVYTGFRPKFVLVKNITTGGVGYDWYIIDSTRNSYNQQTLYLKPNTSGAEENLTSSYPLDFLSNGFKMRNNATGLNGSGGTMIYMAFAENPFKNSNAR